jgi:hypothetical protein
MDNIRRHRLLRFEAIIMVVLSLLTSTPVAWGASHREAPLVALDPAADITDVYAFRSWADPTKVVFIVNVIPSQEPGSGPNYFNFDDSVLYAIHLDTDANGTPDDVVYEIRFTTEIRQPFKDVLPLSYAGQVPGLLPAITALDGPGSEGLGLRQRYTLTEVRGATRTDLGTGTMFAVPSNVGPRTMPDYEALALQGIYPLSNGGRVFAGQRDETFYIDLGAVFDTLNTRRPPILTDAQDANDSQNAFGVDAFSGFNVNSIAIEVPIESLRAASSLLGVYATTSRKDAGGTDRQVSRMGNPLVNELIVATGQKDFWNATSPVNESIFEAFYRTPSLAIALNLVFGLPIPATPRQDLVQALLRYPNQGIGACSATNLCSELLRLDLSVPPALPSAQKRLGPLAHKQSGAPAPDPAGWPNGRRPNDDVTDIALRVVAGVLSGDPCCAGSPHNRLGDGVNFNIDPQGTGVTANGIAQAFPFLPTPHDGRNRRHIDCGESPNNRPCN